jgi:hypothetical protein
MQRYPPPEATEKISTSHDFFLLLLCIVLYIHRMHMFYVLYYDHYDYDYDYDYTWLMNTIITHLSATVVPPLTSDVDSTTRTCLHGGPSNNSCSDIYRYSSMNDGTVTTSHNHH